ncbi:MAG: YCF48-related protein [Thermaerobacter sp.]|nr:YCF48-related protein [Thermaerobacter sp.]
MSRQRALVLAAAAAIILSGCSNASAPPTSPKPLRPITAEFLGSLGAPLVTAVHFLDSLHGWVGIIGTSYFQGQKMLSSGTLLRTTDDGRSWQVVAHTQRPILAIDFLSAQDGFVLAGGEWTSPQILYHSADGGQTLQDLSHPRPGAGKTEMHFSSPTQGFIVSQNTLDITTDGGRTWKTSSAQPKPGDFGGPMPFSPVFLSGSTGFAAGGRGLMRTTDGGQSWQSVYVLPSGDVASDSPLAFANSEVGYAAVWVNPPPPGKSSTVILRTDDGGASWRIVSGVLPGAKVVGVPPPSGADGMAAWGQEDVAIREQGAVYVSRNGGVTWKSVAGLQLNNYMWGNVFTYDPAGRLLADDMDDNLIRLTQSGARQLIWPITPLTRVDFVSATQGFGLAHGLGQLHLVRTPDGGLTWDAVPMPGGSAPTGLTFAGSRNGWVLRGTDGRPLATADGGKTWRPIGVRHVLSARIFPSGSGFLLVQPPGAKEPILLATSDGGKRFVRRSLPRKLPVGGIVRFASPQVGFAASGESVWRTEDGGLHWRFVPLPEHLYDFVPVASMGADPSGDLWLIVAYGQAGASTTPQELWIRHPDGAWQEVRLPGIQFPFDATSESLDVYSRRQAWLATPAGVFETKDGGRTWRSAAPSF